MSGVLTAVDKFREAAILPDRWPRALDSIAGALHSDAASLVLIPTTETTLVGSTSLEPTMRDYFKSPIPDPREHRVLPAIEQGFMPDLAFFSRREIATEPYYQEFLVPHGLGWNATAALQRGLLIGLKRGYERGPYEGQELQELNDALQGLRAASLVASMTWHSRFCGQLSAFERLGLGALLLDADGRVIESNACVNFGDGLDLVGGYLRTTRPADRMRLENFLAAVLHGSPAVPAALTLALQRSSGLRPRLLDGIACGEALRSLHSHAAGLVLITDLERPARLNRNLLSELFGLTCTEARVACQVAAGRSLRALAARLNISEGHARQRLKAVYAKTRTNRQSDLAALLGKLAGRGAPDNDAETD
jgi:DNA-binding CsgD family transcriptional regulator